MITSDSSQHFLTIYVKLVHQIKFGKAIFMVGNSEQLGNWTPLPQNRLEWSQDHVWRRKIDLRRGVKIQYKYVVCDYNLNSLEQIEWEVGQNRIIDEQYTDENQLYLNQKWNMLHISIQLLTQQIQKFDQICILGNCVQLGMKISKQRMTKVKSQNSLGTTNPKQVWSFTFNVDKKKSSINYYYYARKNGIYEKNREPGRYFYFNQDHKDNLIYREKVMHCPGQIKLVEYESFRGFKISKLNEYIYIGPYIKKRQDIQVLKQNNVKAILNLQSSKEMTKYKIDWDWIKETSEDYQISAFNFQITDMNFQDFIDKSTEALKTLRKIIDAFGSVYVHCTAGIYRSPQLVILYLVRFQNYELTEALELMKQKRPYAHPFIDCIHFSLNKIHSDALKIKTYTSLKSFFCK